MNIIFLDIDGVLNDQNHFIETDQKVIDFYKSAEYIKGDPYSLLKRQMLDIDMNKLSILKEICEITSSKIVITSSWKSLSIYPLIEEELINKGIPIIGTTKYSSSSRGLGIKLYIEENNVDNYIILDDEIFDTYDDELLSRLVKTNFYISGLNEESKDIAIKKLERR